VVCEPNELSTLGVNFTNVLREAFTHSDPESVKKDCYVISHFALLGYGRVKAAHKILMKLTPCLSATSKEKVGKRWSSNE